MVLALILGCARHGYKLYPGAVRPASELAKLKFGTRGPHAIEIDGLRVTRADYQFVELTPGRHEISWRPGLGTSWWETHYDREELSAVVAVLLMAGEEYSVHCDFEYAPAFLFWGGEPERTYLWIEDDRNGAVVGGEKKP